MVLQEKKKRTLWQRIWQFKYIYLLMLPGLIYFTIFHYGPMYGLIMAFQKYNARLGILGSQWIGLANFERLFITPDAIRAIMNTLTISAGRLIFEFPVPIMLAILIDEMPQGKFKKLYQTVYTFPHFLSWIIVANILTNMLGSGGMINQIIQKFGGDSIPFLASKDLARPMMYITSNWKGMGWSSIIFLAAISGIDPTLYEAAYIDGAGRWKRIWYITIPSIMSTIIVMLILQIGSIMNSGFDQIFNLSNDVIKPQLDIIDTYVYDITFLATPSYGFSTAVGLFKSIVNFVMLLSSNVIVRRITGQGLFR